MSYQNEFGDIAMTPDEISAEARGYARGVEDAIEWLEGCGESGAWAAETLREIYDLDGDALDLLDKRERLKPKSPVLTDEQSLALLTNPTCLAKPPSEPR